LRPQTLMLPAITDEDGKLGFVRAAQFAQAAYS
jgi:hypothetical protein